MFHVITVLNLIFRSFSQIQCGFSNYIIFNHKIQHQRKSSHLKIFSAPFFFSTEYNNTCPYFTLGFMIVSRKATLGFPVTTSQLYSVRMR